jgi:hypothetical protein
MLEAHWSVDLSCDVDGHPLRVSQQGVANRAAAAHEVLTETFAVMGTGARSAPTSSAGWLLPDIA